MSRGSPMTTSKPKSSMQLIDEAGRRTSLLAVLVNVARFAGCLRTGGLADRDGHDHDHGSAHGSRAHSRIAEDSLQWRRVSAEPLWGPLELSSRGMGLHCESCLIAQSTGV